MCTSTAIPTLLCRCCCQPAQVAWQESRRHPNGGFYLITCATPGCQMRDYTLANIDYSEVNLTLYNAVEHPDWKQLQAVVG